MEHSLWSGPEHQRQRGLPSGTFWDEADVAGLWPAFGAICPLVSQLHHHTPLMPPLQASERCRTNFAGHQWAGPTFWHCFRGPRQPRNLTPNFLGLLGVEEAATPWAIFGQGWQLFAVPRVCWTRDL